MTKQSDDPAPEPASETTDDQASALREALADNGQIDPDDLTRYKTDELRERFQQLFGVGHFLPWAAAGLVASILGLLGLWAVLFLPRAEPVVAVLTFVYMGLQGVLVGIVAAALLIAARLFQQFSAVVDITVQTLREALSDLEKLGDPEVRAELTGAVVQGAVVPALKSVITVKMGLLKAPLSAVLGWLLDKTAGRLTRALRAKFADADADESTEPPDEDEPPATDTDEDPERPEGLIERGDSHLVRMHDRIEIVARRTRRRTLIPAAVVFAAVASVSSIPWLVALLVLV